ncbi:hypothetical protein JW835_05510 [bacterium]|nr:hypothetical protein [bacterium]
MLMHPGDKLHIIARRRFETDLRRHFVGEVQTVEQNAIRAKGYVFIFDHASNHFIKKAEPHTRIFSLIDAGIIINVLPSETNIDDVHYQLSAENHMVVTDGNLFHLDIQEFY